MFSFRGMRVAWEWYLENAKINPNGHRAPIMDVCTRTKQLEETVVLSILAMWAETSVPAIITARSDEGIEILLNLHATWKMT